jgi:hypothetical protein
MAPNEKAPDSGFNNPNSFRLSGLFLVPLSGIICKQNMRPSFMSVVQTLQVCTISLLLVLVTHNKSNARTGAK